MTDQENTMELIPGKRYQLTSSAAGVLTEVDDDGLGGCLNIDGERRWFRLNGPTNIVLELLPDSLPTTPGSVIHLSGHGVLMRRYPADASSSQLPWMDSEGNAYSDNTVAGADVLFDAGAKR
jgi:hypothetical protein